MCGTLDNKVIRLTSFIFLHCKLFERKKTWHSVFYSDILMEFLEVED